MHHGFLDFAVSSARSRALGWDCLGMTTCNVEGCETPAQRVIDMTRLPGRELDGYPALDWVVCDFHHRALSEGEAFGFAEDGQTIRLGANVPPRLISFSVHEVAVADPTLTLKLGHDGIITHEVEIQMSRELVNQIIDQSFQDDSPLRVELDSNKR